MSRLTAGRMAANRLPGALAREIEELPRFEIRHRSVADQVILTAEVRGVEVALYLDAYPAEAPRLELGPEWSWHDRRGRIEGLESQARWNRTLGVGALLRELEMRFSDDPPRRRRRPRRERGRFLRWLRRLFARLWRFLRRLLGRGAAEVTAAGMEDAIRARYREIIDDKAARVERYRQAVARLAARWQRKTAAIEELGREVEKLERIQEEALGEAQARIEELTAAGRTGAEIRADPDYLRWRAVYEEAYADLEGEQEQLAELEADAEKHLAKIQRHETGLEELVRELAELEAESAEVSADLTIVQLEKEIVDLRAGISRGASEKELADLMRQYRKARAAVRVTRQAAALDATAGDAEYLEAARRVEAARRFESTLGLGEAEGRPGDDDRLRE